MTDREFIDFLYKAEKMKCNTRHSWTSSGRKESVAEHSWRLSLMALLLEDEFLGADFNKIIRMCILHDLGEAITGDIPSFLKTKADSQVEEKAVTGLLNTLPSPQKEKFMELFREMEELSTQEAKIYKALDKLEAVIQHNEADISSWLPLEYELQTTYGEKEAEFHPRLKALRDTAREDTIEKIKREGTQ
ncbi:MAG: HD domain-containing protein [Epulopiscium sp.]|nr:HD domain-containing protein [Candidatus Epulonipiscium sp.]